MTNANHLTDEQMLALLHGALTDDARDQARSHLASCAHCTQALARDAALDEVLWAAHEQLRAVLPVAAAPVATAAAVAPAATAMAAASTRRARGRSPGAGRWVTGAALGAGATALLAYAGNAAHDVSGDATVTGMNALLSWQSVIFYIPLAVGILLVVGWAMGALHHHDIGGGPDGDHDVGHGAGHDAEHDHDGFMERALSLLGVGRVPLTVLVMIASLYFGGIGLICNMLLAGLGLPGWLFGTISVGVALVGTITLAGATARLLGRVLPTTETYLITRQAFAGCTGKLLLPADASSGYAQVKDREGNVHNIKCRTNGATLAKGREILVVEYDEETQVYVVDGNPE
jgi:hypothetical protein